MVISASCGDNNHPDCASQLDVYQFGEPNLLSLKTRGEWNPLVRDSPEGPIRVCLDDDEFSLVSVCVGSDGRADVQEIFGNVADKHELLLGTCNGPPFDGEFPRVTGTMLEPGTVYVGAAGDASAVSPWMFDLPVVSGVPNALVAVEASGTGASRVAIRRDLVFSTDSSIPDVSTMSEGQPTVEVDVSIANTQEDEELRTTTLLLISGYLVDISRSAGTRAKLATNLIPSDLQLIQVRAQAEISQQVFLSRIVTNTSTDFSVVEFLPRLENVVEFGLDGKTARTRSRDALPRSDQRGRLAIV